MLETTTAITRAIWERPRSACGPCRKRRYLATLQNQKHNLKFLRNDRGGSLQPARVATTAAPTTLWYLADI
jgi:hypothetical protein